MATVPETIVVKIAESLTAGLRKRVRNAVLGDPQVAELRRVCQEALVLATKNLTQHVDPSDAEVVQLVLMHRLAEEGIPGWLVDPREAADESAKEAFCTRVLELIPDDLRDTIRFDLRDFARTFGTLVFQRLAEAASRSDSRLSNLATQLQLNEFRATLSHATDTVHPSKTLTREEIVAGLRTFAVEAKRVAGLAIAPHLRSLHQRSPVVPDRSLELTAEAPGTSGWRPKLGATVLWSDLSKELGAGRAVRLVLVGEPGMGKTFLVAQHTLTAITTMESQLSSFSTGEVDESELALVLYVDCPLFAPRLEGTTSSAFVAALEKHLTKQYLAFADLRFTRWFVTRLLERGTLLGPL